MSYIGQETVMLFGAGGDQNARSSAGKNHQNIPELLTVTTSRVLTGPPHNGHYSLHIKVAAGSGPTGTLTVWYSNLPAPDPAVDADWVQDTSIAAVDLAVVANTFLNIGNVTAAHVRVKATRSAGTISLIVWGRVES